MVPRVPILILIIASLLLAACGGSEADRPDMPTPVPTYDVAAFADGSVAQPLPPVAGGEAAPAPTEPAGTMAADAEEASPEALAAGAEPNEPDEAEKTSDESATNGPLVESEASNAKDAATNEQDEAEIVSDEAGTDGQQDESQSSPSEDIAEAGEQTEVDGIAESADEAVEADNAESVGDEAATNDEQDEPAAAIEATPDANETDETVAEESETVAAAIEMTETGLAVDDRYAGMPDAVAALMETANASRGEQLSLANGCIGCHNLNPEIPMAGPTWHNIGNTAATRDDDQSAAFYLYNSIVHPNDHIVDGYVANLMLQTYGEILSEQDQADLVAYLLSLSDE